ncbi:aminoglycoside 6-adenylyltransferase [Listeria grandensis]|uniref:Aminoglycoside 6-adenylyltransferase n=1 Tax=Listeria grandensis TaxID=1494963 RepID=A0A7X0Y5G2_9LIST|nr:aminoglycoside 6-adenylyltransferase [Listeria grandensis]MBC1937362.1 aminoglycoside 6-adenylyltransferase [Listeria grandensis]
MMRYNILERIVAWGKEQAQVRALVLEGSLAKQQSIDELSDLDINVWYEGEIPFGQTISWLADIGEVLIENRLQMETPAGMINTQLVIFGNGVKVDFSFWPVSLLEKAFPYYEKLEILLDKDSQAGQIKQCISEKKGARMEKAEFDRIVNEFWFELHYVAKFLKRGEIWFVQGIQAGIRENYLLPLLEESARLKGLKPSFSGRKIENWTDTTRLAAIFADYSLASNWQAMWEEIALFEEISNFIALQYHFALPQVKIERMKNLLRGIQEG